MTSSQYVSGQGVPFPGYPEQTYGFPYLPNFYGINNAPRPQLVAVPDNNIVKGDLIQPLVNNFKNNVHETNLRKNEYGVFVANRSGTVYSRFGTKYANDGATKLGGPDAIRIFNSGQYNVGICVFSKSTTVPQQLCKGEFRLRLSSEDKDKLEIGWFLLMKADGEIVFEDEVGSDEFPLASVIRNDSDDEYTYLCAYPAVSGIEIQSSDLNDEY